MIPEQYRLETVLRTEDSDGVASRAVMAPGLIGADSIAGDVTVNVTGGQFLLPGGALIISSDAAGSSGSDENVVQDNMGIAGNVSLAFTGGAHTINDIQVSSSGFGGSWTNPAGDFLIGSARSGDFDFSVSGTGTTINLLNGLSVEARTSGPQGAVAAPNGVTLSITDTGNAAGTGLIIGGSIDIETRAVTAADESVVTGRPISIVADNAILSFDDLTLDTSSAAGFFDVDVSEIRSGDVNIIARNGASISGNTADIDASADAGSFAVASAFGGDVTISAIDSTISFAGNVDINTSGSGSNSGPDGSGEQTFGLGGDITISMGGTVGSTMNFADLNLNSDGRVDFGDEEAGSGFFEGDGANGIAGDITFNLGNGNFTAGNVDVSADGFAGDGGQIVTIPPASNSGLAPLNQSNASPLTFVQNAPMMGGGVSAGVGGTGTGGDIVFNLDLGAGTATVANLNVTANGIGGDGAFGDINNGTFGGDGGDGIGGTATFNAISGTLTVTNDLIVSATGKHCAQRW